MKRLSLATRFGPWGALAVLLAATAVAYGAALAGPFQLDDWNAIQANARLRAPEALPLPSPADLLGPGRPFTEPRRTAGSSLLYAQSAKLFQASNTAATFSGRAPMPNSHWAMHPPSRQRARRTRRTAAPTSAGAP